MPAHSQALGVAPAPRDPFRIYRICLVCLGNICRSPMAEVILRGELAKAGLAGKAEVDSAGTGNWHAGGPMDSRARAELARHGFDGSGHRARQIERSWLGDYDLIAAMDRSNLRDLQRMAGSQPAWDRIVLFRSFDPAAPRDADVPDPYDGGGKDFARAFDLVQAAARGLAGQLARLLATPA
jgi:protein-tyrosine phosphatase